MGILTEEYDRYLSRGLATGDDTLAPPPRVSDAFDHYLSGEGAEERTWADWEAQKLARGPASQQHAEDNFQKYVQAGLVPERLMSKDGRPYRTMVPGTPQPLSNEEAQSIYGPMAGEGANWWQQIILGTAPGQLARGISRYEMESQGIPYHEIDPKEYPWYGQLGIEGASFAADLALFGGAGFGTRAAEWGMAKGVAEWGSEKAIPKVVDLLIRKSIPPAVTFAAIDAVHAPLEKYAETGEVSYLEAARGAARGAILGAALGPASSAKFGKYSLAIPAEVGTLAVGGAALQGRAPEWRDVRDATAMVIGFKAVQFLSVADKRKMAKDRLKRLMAGQRDPGPNRMLAEEVGIGNYTKREKDFISELATYEVVPPPKAPPGPGEVELSAKPFDPTQALVRSPAERVNPMIAAAEDLGRLMEQEKRDAEGQVSDVRGAEGGVPSERNVAEGGEVARGGDLELQGQAGPAVAPAEAQGALSGQWIRPITAGPVDAIVERFLSKHPKDTLRGRDWRDVKVAVRQMAEDAMTKHGAAEGPSVELGADIERQAIDRVLTAVFGKNAKQLYEQALASFPELKVGDMVRVYNSAEFTPLIRIDPSGPKGFEAHRYVTANPWNNGKPGNYRRESLVTIEEDRAGQAGPAVAPAEAQGEISLSDLEVRPDRRGKNFSVFHKPTGTQVTAEYGSRESAERAMDRIPSDPRDAIRRIAREEQNARDVEAGKRIDAEEKARSLEEFPSQRDHVPGSIQSVYRGEGGEIGKGATGANLTGGLHGRYYAYDPDYAAMFGKVRKESIPVGRVLDLLSLADDAPTVAARKRLFPEVDFLGQRNLSRATALLGRGEVERRLSSAKYDAVRQSDAEGNVELVVLSDNPALAPEAQGEVAPVAPPAESSFSKLEQALIETRDRAEALRKEAWQASSDLDNYAAKKGYNKKPHKIRDRAALKGAMDADETYQAMLRNKKAADRRAAAAEGAASRITKALRGGIEKPEEQIARGAIDSLPEPIGNLLRQEAQGILEDADLAKRTVAKKTRDALNAIIEGAGKDVGAEVEAQKRRLLGRIMGTIDSRTAKERLHKAPKREPHPVMEAFLEGREVSGDRPGAAEMSETSLEGMSDAEIARRLEEPFAPPEVENPRARMDAAYENLTKKLRGTEGTTFGNPALRLAEIQAATAKWVLEAVRYYGWKWADISAAALKQFGKEGYARLEADLKLSFDRLSEVRKNMTPPAPRGPSATAAPVPTASGGAETTGIRNAVTDAERAARGAPPIGREEPYTNEQALEDAKADLQRNPNAGYELVHELATGPRAMSEREVFLLDLHKAQVQNRLREAIQLMTRAQDTGNAEEALRFSREVDDIGMHANDIDHVAVSSGTKAGRGLQARRRDISTLDFSLVEIEGRKRAARQGRPLTKEELTKTVEEADAIRKNDEARAENARLRAENQRLVEEKMAAAERVAREASSLSKAKIARLEQEASQAWDRLVSALGGRLFSNPILQFPRATIEAVKFIKAKIKLGWAYRDLRNELESKIGEEGWRKSESAWKELWDRAVAELDAVKAKIRKPGPAKRNLGTKQGLARFADALIRFHQKQGIHTTEEMVKAVHADMAAAIPGFTEEQTIKAMARYGIRRLLDPSPEAVERRDIQGQLQQVSKLIDMAKGLPPLSTGTERRVPSDVERGLIKQVEEKKKEGGYAVTDPRTQIKTELATRTTRLRNTVVDLEKEIEDLRTGKLKPGERRAKRKLPRATNERIEALKERVRVLRETIEALDPKQPLTMAERLARWKKIATKRNEELRSKIKAEQFQEEKRTEVALDEEAEQLRYEGEQLRADVNKGIAKERWKNTTKAHKAAVIAKEGLFAVPRGIVLGLDFGFIMTQGGVYTFAHPVRSARNVEKAWGAWKSEAFESKIANELRYNPNASLWRRMGIEFTDPHSPRAISHEEIMWSSLIDRIPFLRRFNRSMSTYLNGIRADWATMLVDGLGVGGRVGDIEAKALGNFVNVATGRGNFGRANKHIELLNYAFLAPRFQLSRFQFILGEPLLRGTWGTRALIAKEMGRAFGGLLAVYGMTYTALNAFMGPPSEYGEWNISLDPISRDFMLIRIGDMRINPTAGLQQAWTFLSRQGTAGVHRAFSSEIGYGDIEPGTEFLRWGRSKMAQVPGAAVDYFLSGKTPSGEPATAKNVALGLITPATGGKIAKDMIDNGFSPRLVFGAMDMVGAYVRESPANAPMLRRRTRRPRLVSD